MRIAVVSDIHGNGTALEAVLADLRETSPDLILDGGDLVAMGSRPVEVLEQLRDLGWQGVLGNADEMLTAPASLSEFAKQSPNLATLWTALEEIAAATRDMLGEERIAWLRQLPVRQVCGGMALVHAGPGSTWRAPTPEASDADLEGVYGPLAQPIAVYGHIHRSYIRSVSGMLVVNTGSVSLSYDGDPRAAYLLLDEGKPAIRRVGYDIERELKELAGCGLPHADWVARMLKTAGPQMP